MRGAATAAAAAAATTTTAAATTAAAVAARAQRHLLMGFSSERDAAVILIRDASSVLTRLVRFQLFDYRKQWWLLCSPWDLRMTKVLRFIGAASGGGWAWRGVAGPGGVWRGV